MITTQYLVKGIQFTPCRMGDNELSAVRVAELFFKHVVCKSGILDEIGSDHDHRLQKLKSLTSLKWTLSLLKEAIEQHPHALFAGRTMA